MIFLISSLSAGKWRKRDANQIRLEHDTVTLQCATAVIHKKIYRDLVDFDMHLDDISLVRNTLRMCAMCGKGK